MKKESQEPVPAETRKTCPVTHLYLYPCSTRPPGYKGSDKAFLAWRSLHAEWSIRAAKAMPPLPAGYDAAATSSGRIRRYMVVTASSGENNKGAPHHAAPLREQNLSTEVLSAVLQSRPDDHGFYSRKKPCLKTFVNFSDNPPTPLLRTDGYTVYSNTLSFSEARYGCRAPQWRRPVPPGSHQPDGSWTGGAR